MKKHHITIGLAILLAPIWIPLVLIVLGFHVNATAATVAKIALEKNDISHCKKIIIMPTQIFSPSTREQRDECIFRFAEGTKNPEVCERLLPSEYGLACLSEVGGKLRGDIPCGGTYGRSEVYCNKVNSEGEILIQNPQIDNCDLYERNDLREWCSYERTRTKENIYECNKINRISARDKCEEAYAFKQKDSSLCTAVQDEKRRKYCEIRINSWLKYPELRNSFYFGTPVPSDI